ncbi:hypothetical protein BOKEGFJH_00183 [Chlamydia avium]|uniref:Uncharacterized protein n=2 Tax=Chlamydia avium TaxID=1457141 RepID=W8JEQ8_9CHLA|nr:hypothetical protein [Chlamydia avium]AHK63056.1 Uncharacterized protein M832_01870 [Chlamydia avium 10DC88]EPP36004.1 hypothetical protein CP10743SC13_0511 [Chlamydia psittaci 10_743_SC13]EPP38158.1 hypothetical protein CP10881SC42_0596 [Chlamydia avium]VVT42672.1 hypothetical protein BOKEGFJH_00183 [Chlamydia avium]
MGLQLRLQECIEVFPHLSFDAQVKELIYACQNKELRDFVFKFFRYHPLLKVHDIARAIYLLMALEEGQDLGLDFLKLQQELSGAVRLFCYGGFPWRGLPYPGEHAELGLLLLQISRFYDQSLKLAEMMGSFHQAMFMHEETVFPALWSQEITSPIREKTSLSKSFLYQLDQQIINEYTSVEPTLGFWMQRTCSSSAFVSGSGCKSGIGAYYFGDVGVVNYGPCYGDISDCQGFGISGTVKEFSFVENEGEIECSFLSSTSLPYLRSTGFSYLQDAHLGIRVRHNFWISGRKCKVKSLLEEEDSRNLTFSIFCKGKICQVVEGPRLRSSSLDSYKGPANDVIIHGERDSLRILTSSLRMEIFSLQGERSFWGSNFLINIPYQDACVSLVFEKSS